jgi:imidazole glycerol phosphate synthase glutamine amidotransferase subunit
VTVSDTHPRNHAGLRPPGVRHRRIAVCDYGAGNVRSVLAALGRLGADARATRDPDNVLAADLAVLPGVGSAASAMDGLRERGLDAALRSRVAAGGPTLGICLGLQLALEESEEDGGVSGLGLLPGRAVRLREGRVPRIGWAPVEPGGEDFYFAHSYAAETSATTALSEGIVAAAEAGSFLGVQFHPEKSGAAGARFLARCLSRA